VPERRMAVVAVAFASGILAGHYMPLVGCMLVAASIVVVGLLFVPARHRTTFVVVAAVAVCGAMRYAADRAVAPDDISNYCRRVAAMEGTVGSDVGGAADSRRVTFRVSRARFGNGWHSAGGFVMVTMRLPSDQQLPRMEYGDRLRLNVRPYIPYEPTNPGQFSWKDYLARDGIYCCASVRDRSDVKVLSRGNACNPLRMAFATKRRLVQSIYRIHSRDVASVMSGVVLGTYAYLDEDTLEDFTRTGTMHVLAASGYNCLALVLIATPLLRLLRVLPRRRGAVIVALTVFYLLMVGPVPSMLRAAVMAVLVLLAVPLKRVPDYRNLFFVAGFVVLMLSPSDLFDIGFQLSFVAVWGLIAVSPVLEALLERSPLSGVGRRPRYCSGDSGFAGWFRWKARQGWAWFCRELASVSVATTAVSLATAPIVAYYFNYVSLVSMPANLAVAFAVPPVFFDSLLSAITSHIPWCRHWIGGIGTVGTRAMLGAVDYLGSMRYSSLPVQSPGVAAIGGYYIIVYAMSEYARSKFAAR